MADMTEDKGALYTYLASLLGIMDKSEEERTPEESAKLAAAQSDIKPPESTINETVSLDDEEPVSSENPLSDLDDEELSVEGVEPLDMENLDLTQYEIDEDGNVVLDADGKPVKKKKAGEEEEGDLMGALSSMLALGVNPG